MRTDGAHTERPNMEKAPEKVRDNGWMLEPAPENMVVTERMGLSPTPVGPLPQVLEGEPVAPEKGTSLDDQALQGVLEALLYVSAEPLSLERLTQVVGGGLTKGLVYNALQRLQHTYAQAARGLQLVEVAGGFALRTKPEWAPWIGRLKKAKPAPKISRSAMETLAIIAYKQPIVRSEIEQIRGVESAGVLRTLLEQKLIRIVGRKDIPGRPILYGTTKLFLERFGLRDLNDLPPLRDFKELAQPVSPSCQADQTSTVEIHEESPPETEKADHDRIPSELAPPVSP